MGLFATIVLSIWSSAVLAEDITVSYASLGAAYMDHVVAIEKGYALEEGFNIRVLKSGGGQPGAAAYYAELKYSYTVQGQTYSSRLSRSSF